MTTAHVEMLTASVRTLMIGSRQITLSVAKQLDIVENYKIKPWGRVKVDSLCKQYGVVEVIGENKETGDLVISRFGKDNPKYNQMLDYPLIVLAGLK